ncbi:hypothetical protein GIB67_023115 [Kingdonia uniflora]|uniref:Amidohydrolase 3 domain-containing protein n=1 Tax=Kingdonia uniflora TaxID=39325 RepID=A0A7J7M5S5_9MAGN|nr:hypothetical protein GIB67_023115 [Kingdonia uniflora]
MDILVFFISAAIVAFLAFFILLPSSLSPKSYADLVVSNATIYTADKSIPFAEAMAIRDGRVLRVGNSSSVQDLIGHETTQLSLDGKVVVPGFIDSHVHFLSGGLQMVRVELRGVDTKDEFVKKVQNALRDKHQGSWVLGGGWNNELWGGDLPIRSWVDEITPNNPVWLSRMDGHMGFANSLALQIAGVTNYTEDPVGGAVIRTTHGEPTGILVDSAMKLILAHIPEVSVDERRDAFVRASKLALKRGVTTVVDFGRYFPGATVENVWEDFSDVYQWADSTGHMLIRVCLFFPMETWSRLHDMFHKTNRALSNWIYLGGVKAFADGSLGSSSALFHEFVILVVTLSELGAECHGFQCPEFFTPSQIRIGSDLEAMVIARPYHGEPHNYGLQVTDIDSLYNMTLAADNSEFQVAIHAIGDKANDLILDMYESVVLSNGPRERRLRIEHAQHLHPEAVGRFGQQNIIASMQPDHLLDDAYSAPNKLGLERAEKGSYLFRSLLASNAQLAFGSDWPVADIDPLGGIKTAMKRIPPGWDNSWIPSERITLIEALNSYTISAAYASFLDDNLGSLSPGKLADFIVLSTDSWDVFAVEGSASVEATYVDGLQAYP